MPWISVAVVCVGKMPFANSWTRKFSCLFLAMFISLGISDAAYADSEADPACWVTEFVPGERVYKYGKGNVQRGRTFSTKEITTDGLSMPKLAELFEKHVRATTSPLSSTSQYVSGCTLSSPSGSAEYNASRGHPRYEGGNLEKSAWVPSPSELAAARRSATDPAFVYMQCVHAADLSKNGDYYDRLHDVAKTPIFMAKAGQEDAAKYQLTLWGRANGIEARDTTCFSASTQVRLKAEYAHAMDHYRAGSQSREVDFIPDFAHLPGAAAKLAEKPKPAPTKPVSPGALIVEDNGNAARAKAWDNVLLQAKRDDAARKAAVAAATAESKAKHKMIMDKAIAEAKKRGRSQ